MSNPNDSAFPRSTPGQFNPQGLTKREYFAGLALNGLLSDPDTIAGLQAVAEARGSTLTAITAEASTEYADALLAALGRSE